MSESDAVRIARLDEQLRGVREDVRELVIETQRARKRLHDLEGISGTFLDVQREARRSEERQYRRLELRVQVLTLAVGLASIASPIAVVILTGK